MAIIHDVRPSTFFFVSLIFLPVVSSVTDSEALLKLKQSFTNTETLHSWRPETIACAEDTMWTGVFCYNGIVASLRLSQLNLSGTIDVDALMQLPGLRTFSIEFNRFTGPIPEFNRLGALKAIYLMGNQFTGEISRDYFENMESLKKVWLSSNKFTGAIPLSLGRLPRLTELHLEGNQFLGTIPPLEQPTLMSLDLSNNNLNGEIPQSLLRFNASSFQGNPGLCGEKLGVPCAATTEPSSNDIDYNSRMISYGFLIASSIMLVLMVFGICMLRRRQERGCDTMEKDNLDEAVGVQISSASKKESSASQRRIGSSRKGSNRVGDIVMVNDEKGEFGLADLMKAAAEVLGNGTLGSTYKALVSNDLAVVVKRIKEMKKTGKDEFDAEVRRIGRLKHKNILTPLAYHFKKDEKLLVYEYIPRGSLLHQLHADRGPSHAELNWPTRLKIIQGIALGLGYLHTELSSFAVPHGKFPSQYLNSGMGGTDVVQWAKSAIAEGREAELFDPEIASSRNSLGEMELLLHIGADCTEINPEQRLDIREAIRRIENIRIDGYQRGRSFHELPSLRDGYAESVDASQFQGINARQGFDDQYCNSTSGYRLGHRTTDSFAFDTS